jgi:HD-like signal output (HDOD) protein
MPALNPTTTQSLELDLLFEQPNALPTIPKVVKHLFATLGTSDLSVSQMTQQVEGDPVLTANLLRLTNSAYFGVPRRIGSVEEAVHLLGFSTITTLIISTVIQQGFSGTPGTDLRPFWKYSIHTATLARRLASISRVEPDAAFSAGLMHALGYLVMLSGMPEQIRVLDREVPLLRSDRASQELTRFGYNYISVTEELARRWEFPRPMIAAIGSQREGAVAEPGKSIENVLGMSIWRARCDALDMDEKDIAECFPKSLGEALSLDVDEMTLRLPSQKDLIGPFAMMFK